jgi:hypothetical protein
MAIDFARLSGRTVLPPDNAQNWYRHQLAEFGVLGNLASMTWVIAFAWFVIKRSRPESHLAHIPRGMLIAFACISLVGMPSQDVIAAITFWTAAFWYVSLCAPTAEPNRLGTRAWIIVAIVVAAFSMTTAMLARSTLRVPVRAQRVGWPYAYGFYPSEPDGAGGEQRWAGRHAVAVVDAPTRHLSLSVAVDPLRGHRPNRLTSRIPPVDVKVWVDRKTVIDARVTDTAPITTYVPIREGEPRMLIETRVSRVFRPRDFGVADDRELGLLTGWRFLDREPMVQSNVFPPRSSETGWPNAR